MSLGIAGLKSEATVRIGVDVAQWDTLSGRDQYQITDLRQKGVHRSQIGHKTITTRWN